MSNSGRRIELPYNWTPRDYQIPAWKHMTNDMQFNKEGLRGDCLWHRRAGKDLMGLNLCSCWAQARIGTYWHILPTYKQGRQIVWEGKTRDGVPFLNFFHPDLVKSTNSTEMLVRFHNGSAYQVVGGEDVNLLVGTNPVGLVLSEYSLHNPAVWKYLSPILRENGGWALFIYTARGKNHAYDLHKMAERNPKWFSQTLVAGNKGTKRPDGRPVISDEEIQEERNEKQLDEATIQAEYYCSFDAPLSGTYYMSQMIRALADGRIRSVPWEPKLPVHTAWDLGYDDSTSIWFFQDYANEIRIIHYYENNGEGLPHYAKLLKGQVDGHERCGDFIYGHHYAPHDIKITELGSGKSRIESAKELGIRFTPVRQHDPMDGIEECRSLLPRCYFDEKHCDEGIQALRSYRKEYDDKREVFRERPLHDWSSHGADAFRTLAMGLRRNRSDRQPRQEQVIDDYQYI